MYYELIDFDEIKEMLNEFEEEKRDEAFASLEATGYVLDADGMEVLS